MLVYAALFGVGYVLLRSAIIGVLLLAISAAAAFAIANNLEREAQDARITERAPS